MTTPSNFLFEIPISVRRGPGCEMPANLLGATVPCYVVAPDHLSAVKLAVAKLQADGYIFEDLVGGKVRQLDPLNWERYAEKVWPEMRGRFPSQPEVLAMLETGGVFFGPFLGWDR